MKIYRNKYFGLRHGRSVANQQHIIVSSLKYGIKGEFGLTREGVEDTRDSIQIARDIGLIDSEIHICCSPFSRCLETAELLREVLQTTSPIAIDDRLRERFFGNFEGGESGHYKTVWGFDLINPSHNENGVESVIEVLNRMKEVIFDLERKSVDRKYVLVSHGDPLQILRCFFEGINPKEHRMQEPIENSQIFSF